jgi:alpha-glucosidase
MAIHRGLPGRDLVNPAYQINNAAGSISNLTLATDIENYDGTFHYDTHNFWGSMMSIASRESMLKRRPERRPFVITRSSFVGLGAHLGKWLGDNVSEWAQYRFSIAGILNFNAIYQIPMVCSLKVSCLDVCMTQRVANLRVRSVPTSAVLQGIRLAVSAQDGQR